jgi:hypothetical protein
MFVVSSVAGAMNAGGLFRNAEARAFTVPGFRFWFLDGSDPAQKRNARLGGRAFFCVRESTRLVEPVS